MLAWKIGEARSRLLDEVGWVSDFIYDQNEGLQHRTFDERHIWDGTNSSGVSECEWIRFILTIIVGGEGVFQMAQTVLSLS